MKRLLIPFLFAAAAALTSCNQTIEESGKVITRDYEISTMFTAVDVSSGFHLILDPTVEAGTAVVTASDNVHQYLNIQVNGGTLNLGLNSGFKYSDLNVTVKVSSLSVSALYASGGSTVVGESPIYASSLKLVLSGGSSLDISGTSPSVSCSLSGGSRAEMLNFLAVKADAELSGGSTMRITVLEELNLQASGGSTLYYKGTPLVKTVEVSGGSECISLN
ncbi:MAG: GIN domain-containing protein [Candidatus Cryptobacteroides sp.]